MYQWKCRQGKLSLYIDNTPLLLNIENDYQIGVPSDRSYSPSDMTHFFEASPKDSPFAEEGTWCIQGSIATKGDLTLSLSHDTTGVPSSPFPMSITVQPSPICTKLPF